MIQNIIHKAHVLNILKFQLLRCEDLILFSVSHHCKLNIFGFCSGGWTKQAF